MREAVWERRTLVGEGWGGVSGDEGTTSGASAEFMVIVRVWPSGFVIVRWVVEGVVACTVVDVERV